MSFKLPASLKRELEELRTRAESAGFDLSETINASLLRLARQVRIELEGAQRSQRKANGRAAEPATEKLTARATLKQPERVQVEGNPE